MITFTNTQSGFTANFTSNDSQTYIAESLSIHDSVAVHASSVGHCLTGRRTVMGNWEARLDIPMCPINKYNVGTDRAQTEGFYVNDTIPTRSEALTRMQKAYAIAVKSGNRQLAATLQPMILAEKAKSVKSSRGSDCNTVSRRVRTVTNPRKMSKKLKSELYDTRIQLETPAEIAARKAEYDQKVKVFSRPVK